MGAESHETGRLPGKDEVSNKTSVTSPAEGPPTHGSKDKRVEEEMEMANSESITARNPGPAETREMATKYIKESEDKKISGGGVWAMRRHGGTIVMAFGVKMRGFKKMRALLAAQREYLYRIWPTLKGVDSLGVRCTSEKDCAEQRKKIPYIRSETEEIK
jgi:hypothetical protein